MILAFLSGRLQLLDHDVNVDAVEPDPPETITSNYVISLIATAAAAEQGQIRYRFFGLLFLLRSS